jgi:hypothetical protein
MEKKFKIMIIVAIIVGITVGIVLGFCWPLCRLAFENRNMEVDYKPLEEIVLAVSKGESYPENENIKVTSKTEADKVVIEVSYMFSGEKIREVRAYFPIEEITFKEGKVANLTLDYSKAKYEYSNFLQPAIFIVGLLLGSALIACLAFLLMLSVCILADGIIFAILSIQLKRLRNKA